MRLRSSQFVFLLLLACSLQVRDDHCLRLLAGPTSAFGQMQEEATAQGSADSQIPAEFPALAMTLDPQAAAAERTPWMMSHPASASTAVVSFTGLLRA